jgi:hypothetical protein
VLSHAPVRSWPRALCFSRPAIASYLAACSCVSSNGCGRRDRAEAFGVTAYQRLILPVAGAPSDRRDPTTRLRSASSSSMREARNSTSPFGCDGRSMTSCSALPDLTHKALGHLSISTALPFGWAHLGRSCSCRYLHGQSFYQHKAAPISKACRFNEPENLVMPLDISSICWPFGSCTALQSDLPPTMNQRMLQLTTHIPSPPPEGPLCHSNTEPTTCSAGDTSLRVA